MAVTVLFLLPYPPNRAPSQRFRVETYFDLLDRKGLRYSAEYFWSPKGMNALYKPRSIAAKVLHLLTGFATRFYKIATKVRSTSFVFIHREAAPIGPPFFEWMIARLFRKKIIYDFDDAIWIPDVSAQNKLASSVKAYWKVKDICTWSHKVSVGNHYLASWASKYNSRVIYNPTCVDMVGRYNRTKTEESKRPVIGWTGSHSTLKYLNLLKNEFEELEQEYEFDFLVICDRMPDWEIRSLRFIPWDELTEIDDLLKIDIGIMPLQQDPWSEGKCGFKLIQYLALGIPAVASPVGVNKKIVEHGANGYLCETSPEWKNALKELLRDLDLRKAMGDAGRLKMLREFSTQANEHNFLSLFD